MVPAHDGHEQFFTSPNCPHSRSVTESLALSPTIWGEQVMSNRALLLSALSQVLDILDWEEFKCILSIWLTK